MLPRAHQRSQTNIPEMIFTSGLHHKVAASCYDSIWHGMVAWVTSFLVEVLLAATSHVHCSIWLCHFLSRECVVPYWIALTMVFLLSSLVSIVNHTNQTDVWGCAESCSYRGSFVLIMTLLFIKNQLLSFFRIFWFPFPFVVVGLKILRCSNVKEFLSELLSDLISVMLKEARHMALVFWTKHRRIYE